MARGARQAKIGPGVHDRQTFDQGCMTGKHLSRGARQANIWPGAHDRQTFGQGGKTGKQMARGARQAKHLTRGTQQTIIGQVGNPSKYLARGLWLSNTWPSVHARQTRVYCPGVHSRQTFGQGFMISKHMVRGTRQDNLSQGCITGNQPAWPGGA